MVGLAHVSLILLFLFTPGFSVYADDSPCPDEYVVQTGDTLAKIARRCETTVAEIIDHNPQITKPDLIFTGTRIFLPQAESNPEPQESPAEEADDVQSPVEIEDVYIVELGDTLAKIAKRYGRAISDLIIANPQIKNPSIIYVGNEVLIPSQAQLDAAILQRQAEIVNQVAHNGERWVDVDLATQTVRAYDGDELVKTFLVSTGRSNTPTVIGEYRIWTKLPYDDMRGPGYFLKDVPYVMYFYKGYGVHGTYWHSNFGTPMSHGCVNLSIDDAAWLYEFASVGTLVNVH